jgi:hypothetical protein
MRGVSWHKSKLMSNTSSIKANSSQVFLEIGSRYVLAVVRLQIMNAAAAAQAVAPKAIYRLVLSGASSSLFGNAELGFVAASARVTNNSLMLFQVTLTWSGAFIMRFAVYASGCVSLRCVVLSRSAFNATYTFGRSSRCGYFWRSETMCAKESGSEES